MNNKAIFKVGTFIIVVFIIAAIFILGSVITARFLKSTDNQNFIVMVNDIKTNVDLMLDENAGATKTLSLIPPQSVESICFIDYDVYRLMFLPGTNSIPKVQARANAIYTDLDSKKENMFVITNDNIYFYNIESITVPTIQTGASGLLEGGVYCVNAQNKINLKLTSKGKKVLIE